MSARRVRRALVVVRDGPAVERGSLALRTALALGLGGFDVDVWLDGDAAVYALAPDVRDWLGGDPSADVRGLLDDVGAAVHVDTAALARWQAGTPVLAGVGVGDAGVLAGLVRDAEVVVAP